MPDPRTKLPRSVKPPPLPVRSRTGSDDNDRRRQVLLGTGIGVGVVLLILLLLLLLSFAVSGLPGGSLQAGGDGTGIDAGQTAGAGGTSGRGIQAGNNAGAVSVNAPAAAEAANRDNGEGGSQTVDQKTNGEQPEDQPPTPTSFTVARLGGTTGANAVGGDGGAGSGEGGDKGSEFFGLEADGSRFVYIVDCSGSMSGAPFQKACAELKRSIDELTVEQEFYVFFFSSVAYPMFHPADQETKLLPGTAEHKQRLHVWIDGFIPRGGTNPTPALLHAFKLKPEAIYLLTDGSFNAAAVQTVRQHNTEHVMINTIGFMNPGGEALLQQIAKENRGNYQFVP